MLAKINPIRGVIFMLAFMLLLCGCTPAGPHALLKGKKYLDQGDVAGAIVQFKRAATLLATNASAWNYLGVALHRSGQLDEAATAYQNAIRFDHDLLEARFNLGMLSLEQNKFDLAKTEFTAYTLRRPNDPAGWLELGFAQLKGGGDTLPAERSFSTVLSLKTDEPEAYNGLGLASLQAGKPHDAERFFAAAVQARPDFAPALQNLAIVNQEYLHDYKAALANYEAYLALTPRPANYDEVRVVIASLIQTQETPATTAPVETARAAPPPPEPRQKLASPVTSRPAPVKRSESEESNASRVPQRTTADRTPAPTQSVTPVPTQTVQVQPGPEIIVSPRASRPNSTVATVPTPVNAGTTQQPLEAPMPGDQSRPGFLHRLFGSNKSTENEAVTNGQERSAGLKPQSQPVIRFSRYHYLSPTKPAAGDRQAADAAFTKARLAEQDENWAEAGQWYQSAADFDPSWFEAQYNAGVVEHRLGNYGVALPRYELALALQPGSVDARYNFALALKASEYPLDAANELNKILATHPDEVRAHLTLANLCAQTLHDIPQARKHYLRVLALQPDVPQAAEINDWLSANGK